MRDEIYNQYNKFYNSNKAEFMVLYGMRRIGKTYSIIKYFKNKNLLKVTGLYKSASNIQQKNFIEKINTFFKTNYSISKNNWGNIFNLLLYHIKKSNNKIILFLDEISWICTKNSEFLSRLGLFWNEHGIFLNNLKLIICGSDINFILNKFLVTQSEFNFRATYVIKMLPFNLKETKEYLYKINNKNYNNEQILYLYQVFGGIPQYLNNIDVALTLDENINNLIFKPNGSFNNEFYLLLSSIISSPDKYIDILYLISKYTNGLSFSEIDKELKLNTGSGLLKQLIFLTNAEYIIMTHPHYEKQKKIKYCINFEFINFYLIWIYNRKIKDNWMNIINTHEYYSWRGLSFEKVIYKHIHILIKYLEIKPIDIYYPLIYKNKQYDICIETKNNLFLLELKYTNDSFIIDKEYNLKLLNKIKDIENFTKKEANIIFITNKSIYKNEYSRFFKNILIDIFF